MTNYFNVSIMAALVTFAVAGCAFPNHTVTVRGPVLSREALAFLDAKGATRTDAISNLGAPVWVSTNSLVFLYLSETMVHWTGMVLEPDFTRDDFAITSSRVNENHGARLYALYIAYDDNGFVKSHAVQKLKGAPDGKDSYEDLCRRYTGRVANH